MAGPTLISVGTPEHQARYLSAMLTAEEIWCQGFSEPGAGSDLSGIQATARLEGDRFVVDGQKVWSSYGHVADWCILLTRSEPGSTGRDGMTFLIMDMHAPGVEARPIKQLTGDSHFSELFLTGVEIPVENVVGKIGRGWDVAMTTLLHERGTLGLALVARLDVAFRRLVDACPRPRGLARAARPDRADVDRARGPQGHGLALGLDARAHGHPGAGGLGHQAALVGAEPAAHARWRLELLGPDAVLGDANSPYGGFWQHAQLRCPRQHDRGGNVGDPPQHPRRARARPAEVALGRRLMTLRCETPH